MRVAVIGEGVIGCSSALAIKRRFPSAEIVVYSDLPFQESCSFGPAGLFRVDKLCYRDFAKATFDHFAVLHKSVGPASGVKLLSGYIQSEDKEKLEAQEEIYGDIVYNFKWLNEREKMGLLVNPKNECIHFTSYASEGNIYVPYLKNELLKVGVAFRRQRIEDIDDLGRHVDVIVNCAGLNGGIVAGDGDIVTPIRGVAIEVETPWHKHFFYENFCNFTIPKANSVVLGSVKQIGRTDTIVTDEDRKEIWENYLRIQPTFKDAKVLREWCHLRPERKEIRLECIEKKLADGKKYLLVHNYGHGANGFTLHMGCALKVIDLIEKNTHCSSKL
uniref:DAO domain-containing protein n=1 Tax=Rhabditophanes sp. KR3021 TaxID=114890 RepID=A0AC35TH83_9BILA